MTKVPSTLVAGAEITTRGAPPSMWAAAFSPSVKMPVDSMTTSTPKSPHGSAFGSRSANTLNSSPPTAMPSPVTLTSSSSRPWVESYLSRWALVSGGTRSLTATMSTSAPDFFAARRKLRPIRPNPLMPTRTVMGSSEQIGEGGCQILRIVAQSVPGGDGRGDQRQIHLTDGQGGRIGEHDVHRDPVGGEGGDVGGDVEALGLPLHGSHVGDVHPLGSGSPKGLRDLPRQTGRQNAREQRPGAENHLIGADDGVDGLR